MEYNQLDVLDIIASWVHDDKRVITPFLVANEFCIPIFEVQSILEKFVEQSDQGSLAVLYLVAGVIHAPFVPESDGTGESIAINPRTVAIVPTTDLDETLKQLSSVTCREIFSIQQQINDVEINESDTLTTIFNDLASQSEQLIRDTTSKGEFYLSNKAAYVTNPIVSQVDATSRRLAARKPETVMTSKTLQTKSTKLGFDAAKTSNATSSPSGTLTPVSTSRHGSTSSTTRAEKSSISSFFGAGKSEPKTSSATTKDIASKSVEVDEGMDMDDVIPPVASAVEKSASAISAESDQSNKKQTRKSKSTSRSKKEIPSSTTVESDEDEGSDRESDGGMQTYSDLYAQEFEEDMLREEEEVAETVRRLEEQSRRWKESASRPDNEGIVEEENSNAIQGEEVEVPEGASSNKEGKGGAKKAGRGKKATADQTISIEEDKTGGVKKTKAPTGPRKKGNSANVPQVEQFVDDKGELYTLEPSFYGEGRLPSMFANNPTKKTKLVERSYIDNEGYYVTEQEYVTDDDAEDNSTTDVVEVSSSNSLSVTSSDNKKKMQTAKSNKRGVIDDEDSADEDAQEEVPLLPSKSVDIPEVSDIPVDEEIDVSSPPLNAHISSEADVNSDEALPPKAETSVVLEKASEAKPSDSKATKKSTSAAPRQSQSSVKSDSSKQAKPNAQRQAGIMSFFGRK